MPKPLALDARIRRFHPNCIWSEVLHGWYEKGSDIAWILDSPSTRKRMVCLSSFLRSRGLETAFMEEEEGNDANSL